MTRFRHLFVALVFSLVTLSSLRVRAQGAETAFEDGLTRWKAGDFAQALPLFKQALAATGSPNARFYVARCLRDLGELPAAFDEMSRTVEDARELAETEERYAKTRDAAAAELVLLEARIGQVIIALDASVADAYVTMNGASVPRERLGVPVPVMPGNVAVVAQNPDGRRVERAVEIAGGATKTVTLSLGAATAQPAPAPPPDAPAEEGPPWFSAVRGAGIAVVAVGVGGIVLFAVQNGVADDRLETLEAECGASPCPDEPRFAELIDEGETAQTIAGIGLGVGIAGILAGTAMLIFGAPETAAESAIAPHPGGAALRVRF